MILLKDIFTIIVALEALFIMLLEMFGTQTQLARDAFGLGKTYLAQKEARVSMANQGLYNGFLGVGILIARFALQGVASVLMLRVFIGFIVIAAIFGAFTVTKKIILTQGLPAIIAFILLWVV